MLSVLLSDLWSNRSEGGQIGIQLGPCQEYSTLFDHLDPRTAPYLAPRTPRVYSWRACSQQLMARALAIAALAFALALLPWPIALALISI